MAITDIFGNRRRTTERSSKPDICGIFRSEIRIDGSVLLICKSASKPCIAVPTSYPSDRNTMTRVSRTASSSSTTRILCLGTLDIGGASFLSLSSEWIYREHNYGLQQLAKTIQNRT